MGRISVKLFSFFILFGLNTRLIGQENNLDSLIVLAKKYRSPCSGACIKDSDRVNLLDNISWKLKSVDVDSALFVAEEALVLAQKISWKRGVARGFTQKAICLRYLGKFDEAIAALNFSLAMWEEMIKAGYPVNAGKLGKIKALFQLSNIYSTLGKFDVSITYGDLSLKLAEEIGDKRMMAGQIGNLGINYQLLGDLPKALDYYYRSLKLSEELGEKRSIAINYTSISYVFRLQGDHKKALEYLNRSLKMAAELGDLQMQGAVLGDIGSTYEESGDMGMAINYAKKAIAISQQLSDVYVECTKWSELSLRYTAIKEYDKALDAGNNSLQLALKTSSEAMMAYSLNALGFCKMSMKDYKGAEKDLLRSLAVAQKNNQLDNIKVTENYLSELYNFSGDFKKAFDHYRNYIAIRDSMNNEEVSRKLIKSQVNFEFDKKAALLKEQQEKERVLAEEKSRRQYIIIISFVVVLCIVLFFTYMVVKSLRITKKQKQIIEAKEKETQAQNSIITEQKHLVEEKHKEITDSINYAERIQRSLLASEELLDKNLKEYFVYFAPKDIVSGDFYWAAELNNGKFILATADSTGHGVPGAIMSILNISCLKESVKEGLTSPADILNNTRKLIVDILKKDGSAEGGKDGMDCSLVSFDLKDNKLVYSAANNPVWIVRSNELLVFNADKMPVGKHDKDTVSFSQQKVQLQKGDVVYTFTDGFADQFGGQNGKKMMYKRMKELFISISDQPMQQQKQNIAFTFNDWKGDLEQVDDVCVIGIKI
ncbi:MAG: tetratricopeptide repeat protein [Bacteroidia bacterium]|nr:tetratricopeptide repeat protein [Bacteroidia bacterium]